MRILGFVIGETVQAVLAAAQGGDEGAFSALWRDANPALLRYLRGAGVPVVAVFLSGRPLWVNAEINAADSFVAAWLPGPEGEGIADVLFRAADGSVRHDFHGKLPFSWPRSAQPPAVGRRPGEAPLFPFGYGQTYQDDGDLPQLPEG